MSGKQGIAHFAGYHDVMIQSKQKKNARHNTPPACSSTSRLAGRVPHGTRIGQNILISSEQVGNLSALWYAVARCGMARMLP